MTDLSTAGGKRTTLVTEVFDRHRLCQEFVGLVACTLQLLGAEVAVEIRLISLPNAETSRQGKLSTVDLLRMLVEVSVEESGEFNWVEISIGATAGTITLCNDFDIHVESSTASVLAAAQEYFRSRGIKWFES